jgi:hypothetical protein
LSIPNYKETAKKSIISLIQGLFALNKPVYHLHGRSESINGIRQSPLLLRLRRPFLDLYHALFL